MKPKYVIGFLLIALVVVILVNINRNSAVSSTVSNPPILDVKYYDDASFVEGINSANENFKVPSYKVSGAIVNHHTLDSYMIADLFKKISVQKPSTIIVIGPNHYEKGNFNVLTSEDLWSTKYGVVETEENITHDLISKNLARTDEATLQNDHATTALLPFIKFYMPQVKVVQLLISKKLTVQEAQMLSDELSVYAKDGTVIVASTDFSHYLTAGQANIKDDETLKVIDNFDYGTLFSFNSDHVDSPGSLAVLLMTMQKIGKTKQEILNHANSSTVNPDFNTFVTSYFSIFYH